MLANLILRMRVVSINDNLCAQNKLEREHFDTLCDSIRQLKGGYVLKNLKKTAKGTKFKLIKWKNLLRLTDILQCWISIGTTSFTQHRITAKQEVLLTFLIFNTMNITLDLIGLKYRNFVMAKMRRKENHVCFSKK